MGISENIAEHSAVNVSSVLEKHLQSSLKIFNCKKKYRDAEELLTLHHFQCSLLGNEKIRYDASIRKSGKCFLIELEPTSQSQDSRYQVSEIQSLVREIDSLTELEDIAHLAARKIRQLTQFDRVMIYRFDESWNGQVIAEAKEDKLEPFLHLRYPSTDIPAQARRLYLESRFRMIVDVNAMPVSIVVKEGFDRSSLDLSQSALRAVSPIHIKYLQNMGVAASFSIPLRINQKLWGLISCHHYSGPLLIDENTRTACELASQVVSGRINDYVVNRRLKIRNDTLELTQSLLDIVAHGGTPLEGFEAHQNGILKLTDSSGAFVKIGGKELFLGKCPPKKVIDRLLEELSHHDTLGMWKTSCLQKELGLDGVYESSAGAYAVPFSLGFEDLLIWFRDEVIHEVKWGGAPQQENTDTNSVKKTLEPRSSFAEWVQVVKGCSRPWTETDDECAQYLLFNFVQGIFNKAVVLAQAYKELDRISRAKDEFIGLVSHELRTPLGIILGWIDILKDYPQTNPDVIQAIKIIERNANLQVNLINDLLDVSRIISGKLRITLNSGVIIENIIEEVIDSLKPTATTKGIELFFDSKNKTAVTCDPDRIRQMIWNLISNSIKFTPRGGNVTVSLEISRSFYQIIVSDTGVGIEPENLHTIFDRFAQVGSKENQKTGLGLGLSIVKALSELHGGRVEAQSQGHNKGAKFTISLPVFALTSLEEPRSDNSGRYKTRSDLLKGLKILVAEDQVDAAAALKYLLEKSGAQCEFATNGKIALTHLKNNTFDLILSDVGMPEMDGFEFIRAWRKLEKQAQTRAIPAVALTAYATSKDRTLALEAGFQSHLSKPIDRDELIAVIRSLKN